jgi:hypothetical protein
MYKLEDIKDVHLELTSKCQARCPMCPRRINGGPLNPLFDLNEITLAQFKEWFPVEFIQQLDSLFMCGNLGDPIIAQDCLLIFQYLRENNNKIKLSMHTNGSARNSMFWISLAHIGVRVVFGIDGASDTHELYRIGTDYHQVIRNALHFIQSGGHAEWHMLVFQHNEHEVEACRALASNLGFENFQTKHTTRFKNGKFNVLDESGRTVNILYPTDKSKTMMPLVEQSTTSVNIQCKAQKYKQIYISADGTITPCCWLDFSWQLPNQDNRIDYMDAIGSFPSLTTNTLPEIFASNYFEQIENTWAIKPLTECSKQCGTFDKLGSQFS